MNFPLDIWTGLGLSNIKFTMQAIIRIYLQSRRFKGLYFSRTPIICLFCHFWRIWLISESWCLGPWIRMLSFLVTTKTNPIQGIANLLSCLPCLPPNKFSFLQMATEFFQQGFFFWNLLVFVEISSLWDQPFQFFGQKCQTKITFFIWQI